MNEKYSAFFKLYSLGNILGHHNGYWLNKLLVHYKYDHINEYISDFISLGGINGINIKKWNASDIVMYMFAISKANLKYTTDDIEKYIYLLKNESIRYINKMNYEIKNKHIDRLVDLTVYKYIKIFTKENDGRNIDLPNVEKFGTYASLRNMVLGLRYNKKKEVEKLIEYTYVSTVVTHNSTLGFLLSIVLSYFVSLAVQDIDVEKWPGLLVKLLESEFIKKYIGTDNDKFYDYLLILNMWKTYIDNRFTKTGKKIELKSFGNLIFRMKFYYDTFLSNKLNKDTNEEIFKKNYIVQLIVAYDSLLDCDGCFEKLLFYSIFVYVFPTHKASIGSIAGGLYGLVYGTGDVPQKLLEQIEYKKELDILGNDFFVSYYKR